MHIICSTKKNDVLEGLSFALDSKRIIDMIIQVKTKEYRHLHAHQEKVGRKISEAFTNCTINPRTKTLHKKNCFLMSKIVNSIPAIISNPKTTGLALCKHCFPNT